MYKYGYLDNIMYRSTSSTYKSMYCSVINDAHLIDVSLLLITLIERKNLIRVPTYLAFS